MNLPVNDDWRIQSDRHAWIVARRRAYRRGKGGVMGRVDWEPYLWFTTLSDAARGLYDIKLGRSVRYDWDVVQAFLAERRRTSTSQHVA